MDALLAAISYQPVQRWCLGFPDFIPGIGGSCVPLSPHGIGTMMGFLLGAIVMARRAKPRGIPVEEVYNAVTWGALGAILGARGFYVLGHLDSFGSVRDVLAIWEGGLTMFGGFIGGLVLGAGYLWRRNYSIPDALDAAAPGFVIGVVIGRIGDLFIADHLGDPTDFFLGYRIPQGADLAPGYGPPVYAPGAVVHNTALYDLIGALTLGAILVALARRRLPRGALFAVFSVWYGIQRLVIDVTRNREIIDSSFFGLTGSQWAGLLFAAGGAAALWRLMTQPMLLGEPAPIVEEPAVTAAVPTSDRVTVVEEPPAPVHQEAVPQPSFEPEPVVAPEPEPRPEPETEPEHEPVVHTEPAPPPETLSEPEPAPPEQPAIDEPVQSLPSMADEFVRAPEPVEPEPVEPEPVPEPEAVVEPPPAPDTTEPATETVPADIRSDEEPEPTEAAEATAGVTSWAEERTLWSEPPPEVAGPVPERDDEPEDSEPREAEPPPEPNRESPQEPEDRSGA